MTVAIRYFTKSKKGNTLKLAKAVEEAAKVEAKTVAEDLEEKADILFLVNAMYAFTIDAAIKGFLDRNKGKIGTLINVNSSASGSSTIKAVRKASKGLGFEISEKEFHCAGSWISMNKGRPNDEDLERLRQFVASVLAE